MSSSSSGSPTILLADDFHEATVAPDWLLWRMEFSQDMGQLNVVSAPRSGFNYGHFANGRSAQVFTHLGDAAWTDYRVELDVMGLSVGTYNPFSVSACYRGFSVLFRVQEASESWNAPQDTYYGFSMDTADCTGWSTRGNWGLSRTHAYWIPGTGYSATYNGSSHALTNGNNLAILDDVNHVKIDVVGDHITVTVNDVLIMDYVDDQVPYVAPEMPITFGGVGVSFGWESTGWLDNVVVTALP